MGKLKVKSGKIGPNLENATSTRINSHYIVPELALVKCAFQIQYQLFVHQILDIMLLKDISQNIHEITTFLHINSNDLSKFLKYKIYLQTSHLPKYLTNYILHFSHHPKMWPTNTKIFSDKLP
jgi:hypothetical protein